MRSSPVIVGVNVIIPVAFVVSWNCDPPSEHITVAPSTGDPSAVMVTTNDSPTSTVSGASITRSAASAGMGARSKNMHAIAIVRFMFPPSRNRYRHMACDVKNRSAICEVVCVHAAGNVVCPRVRTYRDVQAHLVGARSDVYETP